MFTAFFPFFFSSLSLFSFLSPFLSPSLLPFLPPSFNTFIIDCLTFIFEFYGIFFRGLDRRKRLVNDTYLSNAFLSLSFCFQDGYYFYCVAASSGGE